MSAKLPSLTLAQGSQGLRNDHARDSARYDGILWRRSGAYFVDAWLILLINVVAHVLLFLLALPTLGLSLLLLGPLTFVTVALAYDTLFIGGDMAATPGMRLFGVEMEGPDGRRPDYLQAFLMTALFHVTVPVTAFLILLIALFTDGNRTAHDILSGMTAVRRGR